MNYMDVLSLTGHCHFRFIDMPARRHMQEESSPRRQAGNDVTDDLFNETDSVGQGTPSTVVPALVNRGQHAPVPVPIFYNLAPPPPPTTTTDTIPSRSKVKIKFKVKLQDTHSQSDLVVVRSPPEKRHHEVRD